MKHLVCNIFLFILVVCASVAVHAATMCVRDDTIMVVLDTTKYQTSSSFNRNEMTWSITFPYGTITGVASCNATANTSTGVSDANMATYTTGKYCWCKMLKPVASKWIFYSDMNYVHTCDESCARNCANHFGPENSISQRTRLFNSIY